MSDIAPPARYGFSSLIAKLILALLATFVVVVAPLAIMSFRTADGVAASAVRVQARAVTEMVAAQSAGALKFGKGEVLTLSFDEVGEATHGSQLGAAAINASGETVAQSGAADPRLVEAALQALSSGETRFLNDGFIVAVPVRGKAGEAPIGAIAMAWTDAVLRAGAAPAKRMALYVAGAVFLTGLTLLILFMRGHATRPLGRLSEAVARVAGADYEIEVPATRRRDEIGGIAKALDAFRLQLGEAADAARTNSFRSAALEQASAALLILDDKLNLTVANPSARDLMKTHWAEFTKLAQGNDQAGLHGKPMELFHPGGAAARARILQAGTQPVSETLAMGDVRFAVDTVAVTDDAGAIIGYIMEWADVSEDSLRAGVIDAIRVSQATAQFDLSGKLVVCNGNFATIVGRTAQDLVGTHRDELFRFDPDIAASRGSVWKQLIELQKSVVGRFEVVTAGKDRAFLDGGFSLVRDFDGSPLRVILIANDVTMSLGELDAAAKERAIMLAAQAEVVDALRVGLKALSEGDLTAQITQAFTPEYGQLREDFNAAIEKLRSAMQSVIENAEMIRGEAGEISNAADDLSRRTEHQAATLEETATALDQLTSSVKSAADGASHASQMVSGAKRDAENSGRVVDEAVTAMGEIAASSDKISKITSLIDDIAFQTNLLALNAGVEAARAGDAGRGFAVVASEVRALAQRSSDAAREINGLISSSGDQVKRGVDLVGQAGEALRGIVASVSEIAANVDEIAMSSREQSAGLAEINASVNQLDQVTQQNAAMFEQTTAASHALTSEVETLNRTTDMFRIGDSRAQAAPVIAGDFSSARSRGPAAAAKPAPKKAVVNGAAPVANPAGADTGGWEDF